MKCINLLCQKEIGDMLFCPYCGTKQEKPKVYCGYCGAEMDPDAVYCNNCGKKSFFIQQMEEEEARKKEAEANTKDGKERISLADEKELKNKEIAEQNNDKTPKWVIAIDLGFPSGTKWANCNVGATKPEDYGDYFAWGETEKKMVYEWYTYCHCDGSYHTCHNLGLDISGTLYDVARIKWGVKWRMPTEEQFEELLNNCTYEWITVNGVNGCKFISKKNGNSIFFPAVGHSEFHLLNRGFAGYSWLGETDQSIDCSNKSCPMFDSDHVCTGCDALCFEFDSDNVGIDSASRCNGFTVRPVMTE